MTLLIPLIISVECAAQSRTVSVVHGNEIFSYTITRYVPMWEVQSGRKPGESLLAKHSDMMRTFNAEKLASMKSMLFARGMMPDEVQGMDGGQMESYISRNRLVMHYRIRYKDHSIFLAHLNDRPSSSVIPFRVVGSKWILDPGFADTDFFKMLANPQFDPYMALLDGEAVCQLGFEEIDPNAKHFLDYSGKGNHAQILSTNIVDGRVGGALKLTGAEAARVRLENTGMTGENFGLHFHLHLPKGIYNTERVRELMRWKASNGSVMVMELVGNVMRLTYPSANGREERLEWAVNPDAWSHVSIKSGKKEVVLEIDGQQTAIAKGAVAFPFDGSSLTIGAKNGIKATIDELRVTR